jgi:RNA polymerase sigma factor (TIGR02999 family)
VTVKIFFLVAEPDILRAMGNTPVSTEGEDSAQVSPGNHTFAEVYEELRRIARSRLKGQAEGHTLQTTALVHEAFIKLHGARPAHDRKHLIHMAAEAMRQILVDHARGKARGKRGGGKIRREELADVAALAVDPDPELILTLEDAICRLELASPRAAEVIKLRFFAGLSVEEAAEASGLSESTVQREWRFARAWLFAALGDIAGDDAKATSRSSGNDSATSADRPDDTAKRSTGNTSADNRPC